MAFFCGLLVWIYKWYDWIVLNNLGQKRLKIYLFHCKDLEHKHRLLRSIGAITKLSVLVRTVNLGLLFDLTLTFGSKDCLSCALAFPWHISYLHLVKLIINKRNMMFRYPSLKELNLIKLKDQLDLQRMIG